jgi:hypothetical protein
MMGAARTFGTSFDELGDGDGIVISFAHPLAGEKRVTYHNRQSHSAAVLSPSHDSSHTRSAWNSGGKSLQHSGHVSHVSHVSGGVRRAGRPHVSHVSHSSEPRERGVRRADRPTRGLGGSPEPAAPSTEGFERICPTGKSRVFKAGCALRNICSCHDGKSQKVRGAYSTGLLEA